MPDARTDPGDTQGGAVQGNLELLMHGFSSVSQGRFASLSLVWFAANQDLFFAELDLWAREVLVVNNKQPMQNIVDRQGRYHLTSQQPKRQRFGKIKAAQRTSGVLCAPLPAERDFY